jgi:hypothetical protein
VELVSSDVPPSNKKAYFLRSASALIHDCEHQGVPNAQLVKENSELAVHYKGKSVAEQVRRDLKLHWMLNRSCAYKALTLPSMFAHTIVVQNSIDVAWALFMNPKYKDLRHTVAQTPDEMARFRQLVINCVMATDIVDKELKKLRENRWTKAFNGEHTTEVKEATVNRKATIVLEHSE